MGTLGDHAIYLLPSFFGRKNGHEALRNVIAVRIARAAGPVTVVFPFKDDVRPEATRKVGGAVAVAKRSKVIYLEQKQSHLLPQPSESPT